MTDPQSAAPRSLALIHTVAGLIGPFDALARQHLPGWPPFAMLDESLLRTTIRDGRLSLATMRRMTAMVWSAVDAGAEAVIVTCSSLGPAVEAAGPLCPVPLFRIDQGMAAEAVRRGSRIGVLATLSTTLDPTADLIRRTAEAAGKPCTLTSRVADGAFALLAGGDTLGHDRLVAEALTGLAQDVDVIVLAQASMARALETVKDRLGPLPVLTSPELGMAHIAGVLAG
ncbi:MAG: aspartate/glutamate racemase family protein [Paracoccaceae bacterium]|nr:aspartate/glutamate racemase family protein [Paracoccaceae bacterium]